MEVKDKNEKSYLVKDLTLTNLVKWLNENHDKKGGTEFQMVDVVAYVRRGHLPFYLGAWKIETNNSIAGIKLYNIYKEIK